MQINVNCPGYDLAFHTSCNDIELSIIKMHVKGHSRHKNGLELLFLSLN